MRAARLVAIVLPFTQWNSVTLASIDVSSIVGSYEQNFDGLASAFNNDSVIWSNDVTLTGWSLFRVPGGVEPPGPVAILRYFVGAGGSGNGRFYSFGDEGESDRALGGVGNGNFGDGLTAATPPNLTPAGWIAVSFLNDTANAIQGFAVEYDGEQWRDAGNNDPGEGIVPVPQTMVFQYGLGSTFGGVTNWISPGGNFDFTSPVFTAIQGPLDGNDPANRDANLGGTITGLDDWVPGQTLWLRWVERNDNLVDHGLAIDNFSISLTSVPEPGAALLWAWLLGAIGLAVAGRRFILKTCRDCSSVK